MNNTNTENSSASPIEANDQIDTTDRRELMRRLGKFAVYAAPFSVLAFAKKAQAGSCAAGYGSCGGGSGHPTPRK